MTSYFLSYAREDHFFAALATIELERLGVEIWRDQKSLKAGADWQEAIEKAIDDCTAVLVALSSYSSASHYVTYEWAYALGKGKALVPLRISDCSPHPRVARIQHIDFSVPGTLPWESVVTRLNEIESEAPTGHLERRLQLAQVVDQKTDLDTAIPLILSYLVQRGYRMASFDRLRTNLGLQMSDADFENIVDRHPVILRRATIKGGKPGLAYLGG